VQALSCANILASNALFRRMILLKYDLWLQVATLKKGCFVGCYGAIVIDECKRW
jgi:hypothetical protein